MIDKQFPLDRCIIDCLRDNYGIEVKSITPLSGGADMNAVIYKIQTHDSLSYFVKLKHGYENAINLTILERLHSSGIQQIIPPIPTIHGRSILHMGDFCLIRACFQIIAYPNLDSFPLGSNSIIRLILINMSRMIELLPREKII